MWNRIKAQFAFSRTIFVSRMMGLIGIVVAMLDGLLPWLMGQDWAPVANLVASRVPEGFRSLAVAAMISLIGLMFEWLRRITTIPLADRDQTKAAAQEARREADAL